MIPLLLILLCLTVALLGPAGTVRFLLALLVATARLMLVLLALAGVLIGMALSTLS